MILFFFLVGLGPQFESCSESFVDEEINGKALLTINAEYLTELSVSYKEVNYSVASLGIWVPNNKECIGTKFQMGCVGDKVFG
jgi:aminopeptidase-like protein